MISVFDLHCDLLSYLSGSRARPQSPRSAYDAASRASIPQMEAGGVRFQTLAVYVPTCSWSVRSGMRQVHLFQQLSRRYPEAFGEGGIKVALAIENASALFEENEPFERGEVRLRKIVQEGNKPLYMSLTWNSENRFGGGALTQTVGLKEEGKRLLRLLHELNIAADLSHASDRLARDILHATPCRVIASHSNFRSVQNVLRNMPTDVAKEVCQRRGLIGLNCIKPFLGTDESAFLRHIQFAIDQDILCLALGADFYSEVSVPIKLRAAFKDMFFPNLDSAATYPYLYQMVDSSFGREITERLFSKTLQTYLKRHDF